MRFCLGAVLVVIGEHAEDGAIVEAEARQHHVGASQFQDLGVVEAIDQLGDFAADAKTENRGRLVSTDHLLREHQVAQVGITNFGNHCVRIHVSSFALTLAAMCLASECILEETFICGKRGNAVFFVRTTTGRL